MRVRPAILNDNSEEFRMAFDLSTPRSPLPIREAPVAQVHTGKKFLVLGAAGGI